MVFFKGLRLPTSRSLENIFEAQAREQEEHEPAPSLRRQNALIGKSLSEVPKCVGYIVGCGVGLGVS